MAGWNWGTAKNSPFLPAVKYGRVVLSPATWRLKAEDLTGESPESALTRWRERWSVPDRVRLTITDKYLSLDLNSPTHRRLLCEAALKSTCIVHEDLSARSGEGWLRGPDGSHEAEIVVPLRAAAQRPERTRRPAPARRHGDATHHTPGGEWLSAHLDCSQEAQQEILRHHLAPWTGELGETVDQWFFIRYTDHVSKRPHLRLRVHGESQALNRDVLTSFHEWCGRLSAMGLIGDVSLHTYRPEVERYGGPAAMTAAEGFFHADSELALLRLRQGADDMDTAADVVSLIRIFQTGMSQEWDSWVMSRYPKTEGLHKSFVDKRREALARLPVDGPLEGGIEAERRWASQLRAYASAVRMAAAEEGWPNPSDILKAVVHMHCNRILKPAADAESKIYAMVRGVVETHINRRYHENVT
jgi:lantibiotic biosynthesis protein